MLTSPFSLFFLFFFFNDTATTEIYTLSLHDALPICCNLTEGVSTHRAFRLAASLTGPGRAGQPHPQSRPRCSHRKSMNTRVLRGRWLLSGKTTLMGWGGRAWSGSTRCRTQIGRAHV